MAPFSAPSTSGVVSSTSHNVDDQNTSRVEKRPEDLLSYSPVNNYDAWSSTNVSHFVYSVQFNPDPPARLLDQRIFKYLAAIVTAEHLILLKITADGSEIEHIQTFLVPDQIPDKDKKVDLKEMKEDLYTLHWLKDPLTRSVWSAVAFAGSSGIIRVVDLLLEPQRTAFLRGHAAAVNELSYCPEHPAFLLSGSKDHTIRLWSIKYLVCLASFGGAQGHKAEIISLDVHFTGQYIVSSSYDSVIKIWSLFNNDNKQLLDNVRIHAITADVPSCIISAPVFSVNDVHDRQIDCVRWILRDPKNYYVVSKSADKTLLIWMPTLPRGTRVPGIGTEWQLCHKISLKDNTFWFVKFALLHHPFYVLALGDDKGKIKLLDIYGLLAKQRSTSKMLTPHKLKNRPSSPSKPLIRSVTFSADGELVVGGSDDGILHIFHRGVKKNRISNGRIPYSDNDAASSSDRMTDD